MSGIDTERERIHSMIRATYGEVARTRHQASQETACCRPEGSIESDYLPEEIASVPPGAYLGEGSGAPVRYAALRTGEVVVDLGSGAGMDSFLAAQAVGPKGRVYGFDLTPDMVERARRNAVGENYAHVTFDLADMAHLPLADGIADAVISNCVINLAPDKAAVFSEAFRVLKPGGRVSVADIVLRGEPEALRALRERANATSWCACLAGALAEEDYFKKLRAAGFADLRIAAERPAQLQPGGELAAVAITYVGRKPA